ncbi:MAG: RluA family pseudouridine synthase [Pseudopedobacter sp.]|nr:RluA family pseudouridine synthase [Deinococcales bacterium]
MTQHEIQEFRAEAGRLDQQLSAQVTATRSQVQGWIEAGAVQVEGVVQTKSGFKLRGGEQVQYQIPEAPPSEVLPENIDLEILFEDEHMIAVNKPAGMVTHPAGRMVSGTLVNALLGRGTLVRMLERPEGQDTAEGEEFEGEPQAFRPGIVHRLDRDTSGVIVVAKTPAAHAKLADAFKERQTVKTYLALTSGRLNAEGKSVSLDAPIGRHPVERQRMAIGGTYSRDAQTKFTPLGSTRDSNGHWYSMVQAEPRTGRTHQIRVHLLHFKAPILGDHTYGRSSELISRHALHAWKLEIPHPISGEILKLEAALPFDMLNAWILLGGEVPPMLLK